jgi:electron transfer flavoprotein alpha subunit
VANILVYIEMAEDRPGAPSLEALGRARRVASTLGATVYAVVPCAGAPSGGTGTIDALSRYGADKIILAVGPDHRMPSLHATHGHALWAALERVPAALVVLAATPGGRDLAPRVAARLGAAYAPEATLDYGPDGELAVSRAVYGGGYRRTLELLDIDRPLVLTLQPGRAPAVRGDDEAEVIVVQSGAPPVAVEEIARAVDPASALDTASVVVTAGAGLAAADLDLVRDLAGALGGEVAVTRGAVERGLGPAEREVGASGRRVAPRLYVACGASGSAEHLAGVAPDAQIVAINSDPAAPIFRVASYGLVGDFAEMARGLIAAVRGAQA